MCCSMDVVRITCGTTIHIQQAAKRRAAEQQKAQGAARKQPKTPNKQKTQVIMTEQHRTLVEGVLGQAQTLVGHGHVQLDAEQMIARLLSLGRLL